MISRGFTVIEFMLVVAIFLALAGLSPAFYNRFFLQDAVAETADRLALSLRNAQGYALSGKEGTPWGVAVSGNSIVIFSGTNFAVRNATLDRKVAIPTNVSVGGFTETVFAPVSGAPTAAVTATITASSGISRTVTMNALGAVSR